MRTSSILPKINFQHCLAIIQDFNTIVSSEISLEMESLNMYKESLISMVIEKFDRLRSGLNSFHGELLLVDQHTKGSEHM